MTRHAFWPKISELTLNPRRHVDPKYFPVLEVHGKIRTAGTIDNTVYWRVELKPWCCIIELTPVLQMEILEAVNIVVRGRCPCV